MMGKNIQGNYNIKNNNGIIVTSGGCLLWTYLVYMLSISNPDRYRVWTNNTNL